MTVTTDRAWAPATDVTVTDLTPGDFVETIPRFTTIGPRGGRYNHRAVRIESGIVSKEPAGTGWARLTFLNGLTAEAPTDLPVRARPEIKET